MRELILIVAIVFSALFSHGQNKVVETDSTVRHLRNVISAVNTVFLKDSFTKSVYNDVNYFRERGLEKEEDKLKNAIVLAQSIAEDPALSTDFRNYAQRVIFLNKQILKAQELRKQIDESVFTKKYDSLVVAEWQNKLYALKIVDCTKLNTDIEGIVLKISTYKDKSTALNKALVAYVNRPIVDPKVIQERFQKLKKEYIFPYLLEVISLTEKDPKAYDSSLLVNTNTSTQGGDHKVEIAMDSIVEGIKKTSEKL